MTTISEAPTHDGVRGRARFARVGVLGLGLLAAATAVLAGGFAVTGSQRFGPSMAVIGVIVLIAALAWRFGNWSKVVAIVCSLLFVLGFLPMLSGLAHPASPLDFVPGLLVLIGVALGIGGSAAAIRHRREVTPQASVTERRIMQGVLALLFVASAASMAAALVTRTTADLADGDVLVRMDTFAFPDQIEARVGDRLVIHNGHTTVHDFTLPMLDLGVLVYPGNDGVIELTGIGAGTYTVYCTLHSDTANPDPATAGMATTLAVSTS